MSGGNCCGGIGELPHACTRAANGATVSAISPALVVASMAAVPESGAAGGPASGTVVSGDGVGTGTVQ